MQFGQLVPVIVEILFGSAGCTLRGTVSGRIVTVCRHGIIPLFFCQAVHAVICITGLIMLYLRHAAGMLLLTENPVPGIVITIRCLMQDGSVPSHRFHAGELASFIVSAGRPQSVAIKHCGLHAVAVILVLCTDAI